MMAGLQRESNPRYSPHRTSVPLAGILNVMVMTARALSHYNIVVEIAGGAVSYIISLILLKVFDLDAVSAMQSLIKRPGIPIYA